MTRARGRILVISGDIESGKTTALAKVLEGLLILKVAVRGVICPPMISDGKKTAIQIKDLRSNETRLLAELNSGQPGGIQTTRWKFDEPALLWGNEILGRAVPCEVLVIDELGPLEFLRNEGFTNGLRAVESGEYLAALVVVRPALVDAALQRWPNAAVFSVTRQTQDTIVTDILQTIAAVVQRQASTQ